MLKHEIHTVNWFCSGYLLCFFSALFCVSFHLCCAFSASPQTPRRCSTLIRMNNAVGFYWKIRLIWGCCITSERGHYHLIPADPLFDWPLVWSTLQSLGRSIRSKFKVSSAVLSGKLQCWLMWWSVFIQLFFFLFKTIFLIFCCFSFFFNHVDFTLVKLQSGIFLCIFIQFDYLWKYWITGVYIIYSWCFPGCFEDKAADYFHCLWHFTDEFFTKKCIFCILCIAFDLLWYEKCTENSSPFNVVTKAWCPPLWSIETQPCIVFQLPVCDQCAGFPCYQCCGRGEKNQYFQCNVWPVE